MSAMMILKIFSDCCIVFAILGSGPIQYQLPLLIPAALCGLSAGAASFFHEKGLAWLRRLCGLLPLAILLLAENKGHALLLAIPAIYTAYVILWDKLELEYYGYRRFFLRSLMLLGGVYVVANVWLFLVQITRDDAMVLNADVILRYGLVHSLCGVVLQRQLRLGVGHRAEGGRKQMATVLGTAAAIVVGFVVAEPLLRQGIGQILGFALSLLLTPFAFLVEGIIWLFTTLGNRKDVKEDYQEFVEYMEGVFMGGNGQAGKPAPPDAPANLDPALIWGVLAGIFLLIAAAILLHSFQKRRSYADSGEVTARLESVPKKKRVSRLSNRAGVRQSYREFLRAEKNRGMKIKTSDTSADIHARIHKDTDAPSAARLRQIYLVARYDDRQTITRAQLEAAKRALKGTRKA